MRQVVFFYPHGTDEIFAVSCDTWPETPLRRSHLHVVCKTWGHLFFIIFISPSFFIFSPTNVTYFLLDLWRWTANLLIFDYVNPWTILSIYKELCCFINTDWKRPGDIYYKYLGLKAFFSPCLGRCHRPRFPRMAEGPIQAGLPSNSGHYLQTQRRKDRAAAVAKVIAVVRGKGEMRECLLDLQWKVNEQRSWAKLFLFMAGQQQWPPFFSFSLRWIYWNGQKMKKRPV